jgi:hypothetical protein
MNSLAMIYERKQKKRYAGTTKFAPQAKEQGLMACLSKEMTTRESATDRSRGKTEEVTEGKREDDGRRSHSVADKDKTEEREQTRHKKREGNTPHLPAPPHQPPTPPRHLKSRSSEGKALSGPLLHPTHLLLRSTRANSSPLTHATATTPKLPHLPPSIRLPNTTAVTWIYNEFRV